MPRVLSVEDRVGDWSRVSASQISMFNRCEQQYAFKYAMRLPEALKSFFAIGRAIDEGCNVANSSKIQSHQTTPVKDVTEIAVTELETMKDEAEWDVDDPFAQIKDRLPGLVSVLHKDVLAIVQPKAVQQEITVEMENWKFFGIIDMLDEDNIRHDTKTAKRSWPKGKEDSEIQPVIYSLDRPGATTFRYDIVVQTKEPKIQQLTRVVTPDQKEGMRRLAGRLKTRMDELRVDPEKAVPTGYGNMIFCSRKMCSFWRECQDRWHLPIKGSEE